MRSECIYSISGRKSVAGNGFSDPDFPRDANITKVNQRLRAA